ncbi:MAG TPA: GNAT family N-acetyltransferase, partial [Myxococcota bacterium]|nr:GNAT family N-acetyltransferase [Myxococcota bacterium]
MADDMRSILDQVAAGSLTPEQAAQLLGEQQPTPVERLLVKGSAVRLTIVADESVPDAVAEGPHRVERDGSTLRIISDLSDDKAAPQAPRSTFMRWLDAGGRAGSTLAVRVNPFLPLGEAAFTGKATVCEHGLTVYMDLTDPEGSWHGINSANRQAITKQLRQGHTVVFDDWSKYGQMIEAYTQTMHRLQAAPFYFFPVSYFEALRESLPHNFHLATTLTPGGEVSGGLVFSEVGGLIQYFLTGSMDAHAATSPAKLFLDGLRRWGIERGCHTLNMGGGVGASQDD